MVRGVIFDFDGLIVDTETPIYISWQEVYNAHGIELPTNLWNQILGTKQAKIDLFKNLVERSGRKVDEEAVQRVRNARYQEIRSAYMHPMPGFLALIDKLIETGYARAVASASPRRWVEGVLEDLNLRDRFESIVTGDDVELGKPEPDCYFLAAEQLGLRTDECLVLEDSFNGLTSAKRAGMRCIVVPLPLSNGMDFSAADLVVETLEAVSVEMIEEIFEK